MAYLKVIPIDLKDRTTVGGATHKIRLTHEDLTETTANTSQTFTVADVVAGDEYRLIAYHLITPFKDASDAAFNSTTVIIGDGTDTDQFLESTQINENGTEVLHSMGPADGGEQLFTTTDTVDLIVTPMTGKSLSNIDVGEAVFYVRKVSMASLPL